MSCGRPAEALTDSRKDCAVPDLMLYVRETNLGRQVGEIMCHGEGIPGLPASSSLTEVADPFLIALLLRDSCAVSTESDAKPGLLARLSAVKKLGALLGYSAPAGSCAKSGVECGDEVFRLVSM